MSQGLSPLLSHLQHGDHLQIYLICFLLTVLPRPSFFLGTPHPFSCGMLLAEVIGVQKIDMYSIM